jgi:NADPH:quinone reductase-like Zn-dependent oxidoreductase
MAISTLLRCLLCGSGGKDNRVAQDDMAVVPVEFTIEGKSLPRSPADSEDSFDSEAEDSKAEKPRRTRGADTRERINRALVVASKGCYAYRDQPFPELEHEKEVVIRNMATGLNPIDHKSVEYNFCLPEFPWITGREMAGVVEAVGSEVEGLRVGDRVWTSKSALTAWTEMWCDPPGSRCNTGTYYRDRRAGCFQEFVTVPCHTALPIPASLAFDSAACLGVAGLTAAMTLWRWLQVPMVVPAASASVSQDSSLLVWGGSTATGQFAIQIAARCGLKVIAVTSAKTKALAESLGAHAVARDGKTDGEVVAAIRELGGNQITRAIDLVGAQTAVHCLAALSTSQPCFFAPLAMTIPSTTPVPDNVTVETVEMKRFVLDPQSRVYALELNRLVGEGMVKLPDIEVLEGGLEVIQDGLERLKAGDMAGKKMVVRMA